MLSLPQPAITTTVETFEEALLAFEELGQAASGRSLVFRGHADESWDITPSIFRQEPDIKGFEHRLIRELISLFPAHFDNDRSMFDRLVRMQHFGMPTRLLDVSRNPLVALYFACDPNYDRKCDGAVVTMQHPLARTKYFDSDVVSCMANLANLTDEEKDSIEDSLATTIGDLGKIKAIKRLVQFIKDEKPYFLSEIQKPDLFRPVIVIPKMSNSRLNAQFGAFIIFGLDKSKGVSYRKDGTVSKILIAKKAKVEILARLKNLGIDGSTLFPELDRASREIVARFKGLASD